MWTRGIGDIDDITRLGLGLFALGPKWLDYGGNVAPSSVEMEVSLHKLGVGIRGILCMAIQVGL